MQSQKCRTCETAKPVSAFNWRKDSGKYRTECESCRHFGNTRRLYGVGRDDYEAMRKAQNFKCAVCEVSEEDAGYAYQVYTAFHIDHCHTTGKVRGLLCAACNFMLGKARDNPAILRAAANYLEQ